MTRHHRFQAGIWQHAAVERGGSGRLGNSAIVVMVEKTPSLSGWDKSKHPRPLQDWLSRDCVERIISSLLPRWDDGGTVAF